MLQTANVSSESGQCDQDSSEDIVLNDWNMDTVLLMLVAVLICIVAIVLVAKSEAL